MNMAYGRSSGAAGRSDVRAHPRHIDSVWNRLNSRVCEIRRALAQVSCDLTADRDNRISASEIPLLLPEIRSAYTG